MSVLACRPSRVALYNSSYSLAIVVYAQKRRDSLSSIEIKEGDDVDRSRATWQLPRIFAFMVRDSAQVLWFIKKNPDSTTPFTDDVDVGDISTPFEPGEGSSATD